MATPVSFPPWYACMVTLYFVSILSTFACIITSSFIHSHSNCFTSPSSFLTAFLSQYIEGFMVMTRLCRFKIDEWMCWIWIFMWDNESVIVCWWSSRLEFQVRCLYLAQSINSNLQSILILQRCISILVCTVSILSLSYSIFSVISILLLRFSSSSCEILSIESICRNSFFTDDHSQYQIHNGGLVWLYRLGIFSR